MHIPAMNILALPAVLRYLGPWDASALACTSSSMRAAVKTYRPTLEDLETWLSRTAEADPILAMVTVACVLVDSRACWSPSNECHTLLCTNAGWKEEPSMCVRCPSPLDRIVDKYECFIWDNGPASQYNGALIDSNAKGFRNLQISFWIPHSDSIWPERYSLYYQRGEFLLDFSYNRGKTTSRSLDFIRMLQERVPPLRWKMALQFIFPYAPSYDECKSLMDTGLFCKFYAPCL